MPGTLIQRFTHGNFVVLPTFSPEADFFVGGPTRQRELIALTETEIELRRKATVALRDSTSEVASVIREEFDRQTAALSEVVCQGADRVVSAVDDLADRVSAELVEIRWQLVQIRSTSDQILQVLKLRRRTEAQELLQQGIRNLVNDKFDQAEERFLKALDLDNTDYQVLMNLAAVALRKGDAQKVAAYLHDAVTLPENLDRGARADSLWSLARLHYAEAIYRSAANVAKESIALVSTPRRLFQYGVYLVLAGDGNQGFSAIESAIRSDPQLFGLAAVSSDLASSGVRLEALLSSLVGDSIAKLRAQRDELLPQVSAIRSLPLINNQAVAEAFNLQLLGLARVLNQSSYAELQIALTHASKLRDVLSVYTRLSNAERELRVAAEKHRRTTSQLAAVEKALAFFPKEISNFPVLAVLAVLAVLGGIGGCFAGTVIGISVFHNSSIMTALMFIGLFGVPLFLMLVAAFWQHRRTLLEGETNKAREVADSTKVLLASATSQRDIAARAATIPAWPLTGRLSSRSTSPTS